MKKSAKPWNVGKREERDEFAYLDLILVPLAHGGVGVEVVKLGVPVSVALRPLDVLWPAAVVGVVVDEAED